MAEIRWTEQAANNLESIAEFISVDSEHYAQLFVTNVFSAVERLEVFPNSGRVVPETNNPEIREIILGSYRVIY